MSDAYEDLVRSGSIAALKRDILLEAAHDVYYLAHIRRWFAERAGADAAKAPTAHTVRVIRELVDRELCHLATWHKEGPPTVLDKTPEQLQAMVDSYASFDVFPFDVFVIATERGKRWLERYDQLLSEL